MDESLRIAQHIANTSYEDIPSDVVHVGKKSLLDTLGVILAAGTLGEGCKEFVQLAKSSGGRPESTVVGFGVKAPSFMAAFANGSMSHALDFEDTHDKAKVHSNAAVIPAALAVAEAIGKVSGKEFLTAVILGSDLVCRLGLALKEDLLKYGWYMPPILSAFGATAAVSKLLRLTPEQILDAFSLTLCQATCSGELTNSPHSVIRSIRDAFPAQAGVLSAQLAKQGVTGFAQPFEGKSGLFYAYARGDYDPAELTKDLGLVFESGNVSFKPWPSCRGTHSYIEAARQMIEDDKVNPNEILEIKVLIHPVNLMLCEPSKSKRKPATSIDAKFSIPFVTALALQYGRVDLEHFFPQVLQDQKILNIAGKVTYEVDAGRSFTRPTQGALEVTTTSGSSYTRTIDNPPGSPLNPISESVLASKFADCARYAGNEFHYEDVRGLSDLIFKLSDLHDITELTKYL